MAPFRIVFVHTEDRSFADTQMFGIQFMPVWAYTLAAHLAALPDLEMELLDLRIESIAAARAADLFLFTGINQDYEAIVAARAALAAIFPEARCVIGGPICWSFKTAGRIDALGMFHHVVVGDGEEIVARLVTDLRDGRPLPWLLEVSTRFALGRALPMQRPLLARTIRRYYGAVLEISRGCPFLCEFCDIRILPDNNRAHVKDPALVVAELDTLHDLGVRQVLLACDNFVGDLRWAEEVCDRILAWQDVTGKALSLYTWLTINVARHSDLLAKLRRAGFDMFFIGVESFNRSSLLETAKVQNTALKLAAALRTIQSHGVIVVAGLIFGFDTDPDDIAEVMLRGILESGLISGDPSLLTALPGTPLYTRMALAGRLRDVRFGLGGFKYRTNIRYLKPAARIRADFQTFVRRYNDGRYQYERLTRFYACLDSAHYRPPRTAGWADLRRLSAMTLGNARAVRLIALRVFRLLRAPTRVWWLARALATTCARTSSQRPLWFYFKFWLFNWSNTVMKYAGLSDADFDVESVLEAFTAAQVLPVAYEASGEEQIPAGKTRAQRRVTTAALREFVGDRVEHA